MACQQSWPESGRLTYFAGNCRTVFTATAFVAWISWSHAWSKSGNNYSSESLTKRSNSGISILEPAFEHAEDISNKNFRQAYCSIFLQRHNLTVNWLRHCLPFTLQFLCARTKTTITVAVVDRFYWNFALCNSMLHYCCKILLKSDVICLSYKKVNRGLLFFRTQCIYQTV